MTKTWRELVSEKVNGKKKYLTRVAQAKEAEEEIDEWKPEEPLEFPDSDNGPRGADK